MRIVSTVAVILTIFVAGCSDRGASLEPQNQFEMPHTPPGEFGETPSPTEHHLLFEGLVINSAKGAFNVQSPGVFFSMPQFPIEIGNRPDRYNPLNLPDKIRRKIASINPEIRIWGTDRGLAVERRGWQQDYAIQSPNGNCSVMFDYRVSVVEKELRSHTTFGRINRPLEFIKVFIPSPAGRSGLYVLMVITVEVNKKRFGKPFRETNTAIINMVVPLFIGRYKLMGCSQSCSSFFLHQPIGPNTNSE